MKPIYCTQNEGDCPSCSLSSNGRDCKYNKIYTVGMIAASLGCHETQACKLLNNAGANPWLDEYTANTSEVIPSALVINLAAMRASDRIGRQLTVLLH
jgi:hypothetical protein